MLSYHMTFAKMYGSGDMVSNVRTENSSEELEKKKFSMTTQNIPLGVGGGRSDVEASDICVGSEGATLMVFQNLCETWASHQIWNYMVCDESQARTLFKSSQIFLSAVKVKKNYSQFSNFGEHQNHMKGLLKHRLSGPGKLGWGWTKFCTSDIISSDDDAVGLGPHSKNHLFSNQGTTLKSFMEEGGIIN